MYDNSDDVRLTAIRCDNRLPSDDFTRVGPVFFHSGSHAKSSTNRPKCASCARNNQGKIRRSYSAKRSFQSSHPCPSTAKTSGPCSGYVIDHVKPLKRGGAD